MFMPVRLFLYSVCTQQLRTVLFYYTTAGLGCVTTPPPAFHACPRRRPIQSTILSSITGAQEIYLENLINKYKEKEEKKHRARFKRITDQTGSPAEPHTLAKVSLVLSTESL